MAEQAAYDVSDGNPAPDKPAPENPAPENPAPEDPAPEDSARVLAALPASEWRVFHDVRRPGHPSAGIDHVVVGPQGVFVIDTACWSGGVDMQSGVLRGQGRARSLAVDAVRAAAAEVSELVLGVQPGFVKPVLCLVPSQPVLGRAEEVLVCSTRNAVTMLTSGPRELDDNEIRDAAVLLAHGLPSTNAPEALVEHRLAGATRRRPRSRARLTRRGAATALAGVVVVLGVLVAAPRLVRVVEDHANAAPPAARLGQTVTVTGNATRPDLQVTVDRVAPTGAKAGPRTGTRTGPVTGPRPGRRWWAEHVTIRNAGNRTWHATPSTGFALVDRSLTGHPQAVGAPRVVAGRPLRRQLSVPPGGSRSGVVVFDLPSGEGVSYARITLGPEPAMTLRWSTGR